MDGTRQNMIVVGVDGSDSARHAVRWAAAEAVRRSAGLRLVQTFVVPTSGYPGFLVRLDELRAGIRAQGEQWLSEAAAVAETEAPGLAVEQVLVEGNVVPVLVRQSKETDLVVLGSRGLGAFTGMLVGSTAVALAAHGHSPVAIVRGPGHDADPPVEGPVVVGLDGSPASAAAIGPAFEEASLRAVPLLAVRVWNDLSVENPAYMYGITLDPADIEKEEHRLLTEQLSGWQEKYPDVRVERIVARGRTARRLLDHCARAQMVVVGSRGRGGFTGMLLGSTSRALITHAPCPVLVVRSDDLPQGS